MYVCQWHLRWDVKYVHYKQVFTMNGVTITRVRCMQEKKQIWNTNEAIYMYVQFILFMIHKQTDYNNPPAHMYGLASICVQFVLFVPCLLSCFIHCVPQVCEARD